MPHAHALMYVGVLGPGSVCLCELILVRVRDDAGSGSSLRTFSRFASSRTGISCTGGRIRVGCRVSGARDGAQLPPRTAEADEYLV